MYCCFNRTDFYYSLLSPPLLQYVSERHRILISLSSNGYQENKNNGPFLKKNWFNRSQAGCESGSFEVDFSRRIVKSCKFGICSVCTTKLKCTTLSPFASCLPKTKPNWTCDFVTQFPERRLLTHREEHQSRIGAAVPGNIRFICHVSSLARHRCVVNFEVAVITGDISQLNLAGNCTSSTGRKRLAQ